MPRQRRGRRLTLGGVAAVGVLSLAATALPQVTAPPRAAAVATAITAAGEPLALPGVETVAPIPARDGSGAAVPPLPETVAQVPGGQAMHGTNPWLRVPGLRDGTWPTTVTVRLYDASRGFGDRATDGDVVWEGQLTSGWGRVTRVLEAGHGYALWGRAPGDQWVPLGRFSVRGSLDPAGPTTQAGGLVVAQASGELTWGWDSMPLPGPVKGVNVGLQWQARQPAEAGLPAGWRLMANSGSPWATLEESGPRLSAIASPARPGVQRVSGQRARLTIVYPTSGRIRPTAFVAQQLVGTRWIPLRGATALAPGRQVVTLARGASSVRVGVSHRGRTVFSRGARIVPAAALPPVTAGPADTNACGSAANTVGAPEAVLLRGWSGMSMTFRRNDAGVYVQTFGGERITGFRNTLAFCDTDAGRAWLFTDSSGVVTRFEGGRAVSVSNQGQPVSTLTWQDERLVRVTNAVGRAIRLVYAGSGDCPSAAWERYSAPPAGMLCRLEYPGGVATDIGYVSDGLPAPQIGLVKDPGNAATALGWDAVGRLAATRAPIVNRVATVNVDAAGVIATAGYDAQGRALTLTEAPGSVGGESAVQTLALPVINEAALKSGAPVTSRVTSAATGYSMFTEVTVEPENLEQRTSRDAAGSATSVSGSGDTTTQTDARGLVTTSTTDQRGNVLRQEGPVRPGVDGTRLTGDYDSTYTNGTDVEYEGFRALVYPRAGFSGAPTPAHWKPVAGNGLAVRWDALPTASMSAVATGVWTPTDALDDAAKQRGWSVSVLSSPGVIVRLLVGDEVCDQQACTMRLPTGPKQVTIEVQQGQPNGSVAVLVAPAPGTPVAAPTTSVRPGFGNLTKVGSNDVTAAQRHPDTEYAYARPETGQATTVTFAGGLTARMEYEDGLSSAGRWGRLTRFTTPGGRTQQVSYWANSGAVDLPAVCGGAGAAGEQAGQPRTITRQDGIRLTTYYDARGRVVAGVTEGTAGDTETVCTTYADDDMPVSSSVFNSSGTLVERVETVVGIDGDPLTREQTVTHGAGAPVDPGRVVRSRTTDDLRGFPVRYQDAVGTVTTTGYTPFNDPAVVTVTPPGAASPLLTFEYAYRSSDRAPTTVTVNGAPAAEVRYAAAKPQVESVSYAGGAATLGLTYSDSGRPKDIVARAGDNRYSHSLTYNTFGRILSARVSATEGDRSSSEARAYTYDADGRLTNAVINSTAAATTTSTRYGYSYATQSSACGARAAAYPRAGADALRTGGSRSGTAYVMCHDAQGRVYSTSDPLVTGGGGTASIEYDALGRVTSITGAERPLAITWGAGSSLARVAEGSASEEVVTTFDTYGGQVVEKQVDSPAGSQTVRYGYTSPASSAPLLTLPPERAPPGDGIGVNYPLPGGVRVDAAPGAVPVLSFTGLDGSSLATVPVPSLAITGVSGPAASRTGLDPRFGPYGEPLATPRLGATGARPVYSWLSGQRQETLAGTASISMIGARAYLPALGQFLSPDPKSESGTNLYSYTPADPINGGDPTGQANEWSWFWQIVSAVLIVAAIAIDIATLGVATPVTGAGVAAWAGYIAVTVGVPVVAWWAVGKAQEASFRAQTEPSEGLDNFRMTMAFVQLGEGIFFGVHMVVSLGKYAATSAKRWWRNRSIKQTFKLTEDLQSEVAVALSTPRRSVSLSESVASGFGALELGGSQALERAGRLSVGRHAITGNTLRLAHDRKTFIFIADFM